MLRDAKIRTLKERVADAQYCGTFDCAYPVYECDLELRMLALERLSAIQEYVLRAVSLGAGGLSGIDLILGLGLPATRRAVADLLASDLVQEEWSNEADSTYTLSKAGVVALEQVAVQRTITTSVNCIVDGVTGGVAIKPGRARYMTAEKAADAGMFAVPTKQDAPTVDSFDLKHLNDVLRSLSRRDPDRWPQGEVLDLQRIVRSQRRYRRLDVVVFQARADDWIAHVFERHAEQRELGRVFASLLASDPGLLPLDRSAKLPGGDTDDGGELTFLPPEVAKEAVEAAEQALVLEEQLAAVEAEVEAIKEASPEEPTTKDQLAALEGRFVLLSEQYANLQAQIEQRVTRIGTDQHRPLLERALKHAKDQVIIISPWIAREAVVGEVDKWLLDAIRRGVRVRIGWGFSDETRDQVKERASKDMADHLLWLVDKERRERGPLSGALEITRLGNSHEKILIADTNFCVVTSFNWLSFKGDKRKRHRRETGARIGIPELVANWRKDFEGVLDEAAKKGQASSRTT